MVELVVRESSCQADGEEYAHLCTVAMISLDIGAVVDIRITRNNSFVVLRAQGRSTSETLGTNSQDWPRVDVSHQQSSSQRVRHRFRIGDAKSFKIVLIGRICSAAKG